MATPTATYGQTQVAPSAKIRNPIAIPLLSIITFGIYYLVYLAKTGKSIKQESGIGPGGIFWLLGLIPIVNIAVPFILAGSVGQLRQRGGLDPKVSAMTAFWNLLPIIGVFVYFVKVQGGLNEYWRSRGVN